MASGDPVGSADSLLAGLPARDRAIVLARLRRESMSAPLRFPASAAQRRLWYLAALDGTSDAYGVTQAWLIDGILDIDALRRAFGRVIERHEPLRTTFEVDGSGLWQVVRDPGAPELVTSDLSGFPDPLRQALDDAARWGAEPFDLDAGPLIRLQVGRLGGRQQLLTLAVHHIACDAWSIGIFYEDLAEFYAADVEGRAARLADMPIQYADLPRAAITEADLEAWREELAGVPPLALATDRERPSQASGRGGARVLAVDGARVAGLRALASRQRASLFMALLASFEVLLARHNDADDFAVGCPVAGRQIELTERMIAPLFDLLPLRSDVVSTLSFNEVLTRVRERVLVHLDGPIVPFDMLVRSCAVDQTAGRHPLFQVMLALQNVPNDVLRLTGASGHRIEIPGTTAKLDLSVTLQHAPDGSLVGVIEWAEDLFDAATIDRLCDRWMRLIDLLPGQSGTPVGELAIWTAADCVVAAEGLRGWLAGESAGCVHELFEGWVGRSPDAVAVWDGRDWSYRDVDAMAEGVAAQLRVLGVGPEVVVGVMLPRDVSLVAGMLGVLKAGGAYLPLDEGYPDARLRFMVADCAVSVVVCGPGLRERAAGLVPSVVEVVPGEVRAGGRAGVRARPANLAYVIYTSGSTGTPKGVAVEHRNVTALFEAAREHFDLAADDAWSVFHSASFDFSVWEIWGALCHGGRAVILTRDVARDPDALLDVLRTQKVSILSITPPAFASFVISTPGQRDHVPSLRYVVFGGDVLRADHLNRWTDLHGLASPALVNMYGITEGTVHVTVHRVTQEDLIGGPHSRIGSALRGVGVAVVDGRGQTVGVGVAGELWIGGRGVARGYVGRGRLTAERFGPAAWGDAGRWYRTGDRVRWRADGTLDFLGRADHQVKVRGYRIELGEVEAAIRLMGEVSDVVVVTRDRDRAGVAGRELVAYVVARPGPGGGPGPDADAVRRFVRDRLPSFMVPATVVMLARLPLTANGKVDRAALPEPADPAPDTARYVAPRDNREQLLAEVWAQVLGLPRISVHDNFFDVGGDSMRTIQVRGALRAAGWNLDIASLMRTPTVAALAGAMEPVASGPGRPAAQAFELLSEPERSGLPPGLAEAYPCTQMQASMVAAAGTSENPTLYHDVFDFIVGLPLDRGRLRTALDDLTRRHPVLRTYFDFTRSGRPLQLVRDAATIELHTEEEARPRDLGYGLRTAWSVSELSRPFELGECPLLRMAARELGPERFLLSLSFHHAILDGWSVSLAVSELLTSYACLIRGEGWAEPPAPPPFSDYVRLELASLGDPRERAFWAEYLAAATMSPLPRTAAERPAPAAATGRPPADAEATAGRVCTCVVALDAALMRELRNVASRHEVPLRTALLAAHLQVASVLLQTTEVMTGVVTNCRPEDLRSDRALGLFLNTLPLRGQVADRSWSQLIEATREAELEILPHRWYPLAAMQREHGTGRLFEMVFNYTDFQEYSVLKAARVALEGVGVSERTDIPFMASFGPTEQGADWQLVVRYDAIEVPQPVAARAAALYEDALRHLASFPARRYDVSRLTAADCVVAAEGLRGWLAGESAGCVHELFEGWVGRSPDAVAVWDGRDWSYRDVDAMAEGVAAQLRVLGVGPEVVVGVMLPRDVSLVAGMLGVLKAGGAYLPLDEGYPDARLRFMVADCAVSVVVCGPGLRERAAGLVPSVVEVVPGEVRAGGRAGVRARPANLAYVIYTSGSTGTPKGVAVEHRNVTSTLTAIKSAVPAADLARVFATTTASFDVSAFELFTPLAAGGTVVVGSDALDVDSLVRGCPTLLSLVPSALGVLIREGTQLPPAVRHVVVAGEALTDSLAGRFRERYPGVRLSNAYGPTEAAIYATASWAMPTDQKVSIGSALRGVGVAVVDGRGQTVGVGVAGELWIGGRGVARGYVGRGRLTAERFGPAAWGDAGRWYRTGDRVRWRADGTLDFLGRADHQVKVRGYRIELGEVEAAIRLMGEVSDVVVVTRDRDRAGVAGRELVAYVVARPGPGGGPGPDADAVRRFVRDRLPSFMVPATVVMLARLPLTANGKVDRAALPEPADPAPDTARYVAPRDNREQLLAEVWAQVLGLPRISVHDNFFDVGGDSIRAFQIAARCAELGLRIRASAVLGADVTVARLAADCGQEVGPDDAAGGGRMAAEAPFTAIQRWWLSQRFVQPGHWNQAVRMLCQDPRWIPLLPRALELLTRRHPVLSCRFDLATGRMRAGSPAPVTVTHVALEGSPDLRQRALSGAVDSAHAALDPEMGHVLRLVVGISSDAPAELVLLAHHLAVDVVSWRIMQAELVRILGALVRGEEPPALREETTFLAWAQALDAAASAERFEHELGYWRAIASRARHPSQPTGRESDERHVAVSLETAPTQALWQRIRREPGMSAEDLLLAALARALVSRWGGAGVLIDVEGHGRTTLEDVDVSTTVGWFTVLYPLWVSTDAGNDVGQEAARIAVARNTLPSGGLGYGVLRYVGRDPVLAGVPGVEVSFNFLGYDDSAGQAITATPAPGHPRGPENARTHRLAVTAWVSGARLWVDLSYASDVDDRAFAQSVLDALRADLLAYLDPGSDIVAPTSRPADEDAADVYPLAPMQQGILLHELMDDDGLYWVQVAFAVAGARAADVPAAWQLLVERHDVLRTAVQWEDRDEPVQVVSRQVRTEVPVVTRTGQDPRAVAEDYMRERRRHLPDLGVPPLSRISVLDTGDDRQLVLLWEYHHLILDGWSMALLWSELLALLEAASEGRPAPAPPQRPPYRQFVHWSRHADSQADKSKWRGYLDGARPCLVSSVPRTSGGRNARSPAGEGHVVAGSLSGAPGENLMTWLQALRVTPAVTVQAAWALALVREEGEAVFGLTVAGRPVELAGSDSMVGLLINTVPVRIAVRPPDDLPRWLQDLQRQANELAEARCVPLRYILAVVPAMRGKELFDTQVVFRNYPGETRGRRVRSEILTSAERTNFAISVVAWSGPARSLHWRLSSSPELVDGEHVTWLGRRFTAAINSLAQEGISTVGGLLNALPVASP